MQTGNLIYMLIITARIFISNYTAFSGLIANRFHWPLQWILQVTVNNSLSFSTQLSRYHKCQSQSWSSLIFSLDWRDLPRYIANAIYGRIPGAQLANRTDYGQIWQLPCDKEVNVTFIFGGKHIPIHPLDTNLQVFPFSRILLYWGDIVSDWNVTDNNGNHVCLGAVRRIRFFSVQILIVSVPTNIIDGDSEHGRFIWYNSWIVF
jgi:hypothetical protein